MKKIIDDILYKIQLAKVYKVNKEYTKGYIDACNSIIEIIKKSIKK